MLRILNNLPKEYDSILDSLENQLGPTVNNALTLEIIREKLGNRFACIKKQEDGDVNKIHKSHKEAVVVYPNQFRGSCNSCGKYGHQGKRCPDKQELEFPQGKCCWICDQKGHSMFTCGKFKVAKSKNEQANFACDLEESDNESLDELAFLGMKPEGISCDMILDAGYDTLSVEIASGCNSHLSDERALKCEDTVSMKYSKMIHKAKDKLFGKLEI